jgi:hypothetical protein
MEPQFFMTSKVIIKISVCTLLISSILFSSLGAKSIVGVTGIPTPENGKFPGTSLSILPNKPSVRDSNQNCLTYPTNSNPMEVVRVSSSITGKYPPAQISSKLNPHSAGLSTLKGKVLMNEPKIALVFPTFTAAAYDHAFYKFYRKHINTRYGQNVTEDLNLLSTKVKNEVSPNASGPSMLFMIAHLENLVPHLNLEILTDQDVDDGCTFLNGRNNAFDLIILGHQEYVTQKEYANLKKFVANGGIMILLDGNVFFAEVKYDRNTDNITLVKGHSWAFNGKSAWRSISERWEEETKQWVGSNYFSVSAAKFLNDPFEYLHHEEQSVTNPRDNILLDYKLTMPADNNTGTKKMMVAAYELGYLKGKVISLGIYSDDIIRNLKFDKYFDNLVLHNALAGTHEPVISPLR